MPVFFAIKRQETDERRERGGERRDERGERSEERGEKLIFCLKFFLSFNEV